MPKRRLPCGGRLAAALLPLALAGCGGPGKTPADTTAGADRTAASAAARPAVDDPGARRADAAAGAGPAQAVAAQAQAAQLAVPAADGSGQPRLSAGPGGQLVMSWLQPDGDGYALEYARFGHGAWGPAATVARGENLFVNWADLPSVRPITADVWVAHWLALKPDSFESYDIEYAVSADGGKTWSAGRKLNADNVLAEHGFVSLFPWKGEIGAVWLDGRRTAQEGQEADSAPPGDAAPPAGQPLPAGMSLRYARLAYDGRVDARGEIDALVCDCCKTDAAQTEAGPVIIYRDRTPAEIRDVAVRRASADGWSTPVVLGPDHWKIEGCPVNGPAIAARGGTVVAAWFTAANGEPKVRVARSGDGGATFGAPVDVDADGAFGQVDVVLLEGGAAVVSWWRRADDAQHIALAIRKVAADGRLGPTLLVARNESARPLDVPQMAEADGRLVFAWTDAAGATVESAAVPLP